MDENRRSTLAGAVVMRNALVRPDRHGDSLRLTAPVERTGWARAFGSGAREKTFELDQLGAWVWQRIDGTHTVETLIETFAKDQRINLREAEVAVVAFLKMLVKRGLAGVVVQNSYDRNAEAKDAPGSANPLK